MSKLCKQINKYLIATFGIFAIVLLTIFAVGYGAGLSRITRADDTTEMTVTASGFWTDSENLETVNLTTSEISISTPGEFAYVCNELNTNGATNINGKTFKIKNDLDFGAHYWQPMGVNTDGKNFSAQFIADNVTGASTVKLKNIFIDNSIEGFNTFDDKLTDFGLFGRVDNCTAVGYGVLKNIELENIYYKIDVSKVARSEVNIGGVAGYFAGQNESFGSAMMNCSATGIIEITQSGTTAKTVNIGGVVGKTNSATGTTNLPTITYTGKIGSDTNYLTNNVKISVTGATGSTYAIGGIIGSNLGELTCQTNTTDKKVLNSGTISANIGTIGGLVGENCASGTISNLTSGSESDSKTTLAMPSGALASYTAGGIAGRNRGEIAKCTNLTQIEGYNYALGGIVGENYGTISSCSNKAKVFIDQTSLADTDVSSKDFLLGGIAGNSLAGTIKSCQNQAEIGGVKYDEKRAIQGNIGGIVGQNGNDSTITNCVNYGTIGENMRADASGGIAGSSAGTITSDTLDTTISKFTVNLGKIIGNRAGGIVGDWNNFGATTPTIVVKNCYNKGEVTGYHKDAFAGGIVGLTQNNQTDSKIENCLNFGKIGALATTVGGIVGQSYATFSIKNCANYGTLSGFKIGGIVGYVYNTITLDYVLSTGSLSPADSKSSTSFSVGGIVGEAGSNVFLNLETSVFDIGSMGYNLPERVNSGKKIIYELPAIGSDKNFVIYNAPLTYYMTKPGVSTVTVGSYYIFAFKNSIDWVFRTANTTATAGTYYYPIPKEFSDGEIFVDDTSEISETSLKQKYPSQQLSKVKVTNKLPTKWEKEANKIKDFYINIYPDILFDAGKSSAISGEGQYVITGQKIAKPTEVTNPIYISAYDTEDKFVTAVNELAKSGQFDTHEGFTYAFKNRNSNSAFSFDDPVSAGELNIDIVWTAKKIQVTSYEYDYEKNEYVYSEEFSLTYSLNPDSKQEFNPTQKTGRTYYYWRTDAGLKYNATNEDGTPIYESEEDWVKAWESSSIKEINCNSWEPKQIYFMSVAKNITLILNGGSVTPEGMMSAIYGTLVSDSGDTKMQISMTIKWGEQYDLQIPTISMDKYAFRGYFDGQEESGNCVFMEGGKYSYTGAGDSITLYAHWTYLIKYITLVTVTDTGDKTLDTLEIDYNKSMQEAGLANMNNWGLSYTMIDSSLDPNGYSLEGAYSDKTNTTKFDFDKKILDDTTIYVTWQAKNFRLELNANIGKDLNNNLRTGGWTTGVDGMYSTTYTLMVPYNVNLVEYLKNNPPTSNLVMTGFTPMKDGLNYKWALKSITMGAVPEASDLLSNSTEFAKMPANDNLKLYIIWQREKYNVRFDANGGYFAGASGSDSSTTKTYQVDFETKLSTAVENLSVDLTTPLREDWIFKYWSKTDSESGDAGKILNSDYVTRDCTLYAIYGEKRVVRFYVIGAYPEDLLGEIVVYDGALLSDNIGGDIIKKMNDMLSDSEGNSAFELDFWVEMTYDNGYNVTELGEFDFDTHEIKGDINLLAKLKPNANYVPPSKDTTNYIIIAGVIVIVALILLFVVLLARPTRIEYTSKSKTKNKDIQAQLDEIRELERRRRDMDNPYD